MLGSNPYWTTLDASATEAATDPAYEIRYQFAQEWRLFHETYN